MNKLYSNLYTQSYQSNKADPRNSLQNYQIIPNLNKEYKNYTNNSNTQFQTLKQSSFQNRKHDLLLSLGNTQKYSNETKLQAENQNMISNREKINKLHQRIKMLDRLSVSDSQQNGRFNNREHIHEQINQQTAQNISKYQQDQDQKKSKDIHRSVSPKQNKSNGNFNAYRETSQVPPSSFSQHNRNNFMSSNTYDSKQHVQQYYSPKHNNQSQNYSFVSYNQGGLVFRPLSQQIFPLQSKYLAIEDKFLKFKLSQQQLIKNIQSQISQVIDNTKNIKKDVQKLVTKNEQTLDQTEKYMNSQLNQLNQQLKDLKKGAIQSIDNKYKAIKTQTIALIGQEFETQCKQASLELGNKIQHVQKQIDKQANIRDQTAEFLINSFGDQIIRLEEVLNQERQTRVLKNDELLKRINDVEDSLTTSLVKQKKQMMETIQQMENMLEEVCYKIQEKILGVQ